MKIDAFCNGDRVRAYDLFANSVLTVKRWTEVCHDYDVFGWLCYDGTLEHKPYVAKVYTKSRGTFNDPLKHNFATLEQAEDWLIRNLVNKKRCQIHAEAKQ